MANLSLNARGAEVKELHARLAKLGVSIPKRELDEEVFGAGTQSALLNFQANHKLRRTGVLDDRTRAALARAVAKAEIGQPRVEGRVFFENGLPAAGVTIRAYHRGFGGAETQLGEETTTDPQGFYTISYDPPGRRAANLELRVVGAAGQESSLCATKFHAERHEVMNLVVPTKLRPPASEFERLNADLGKQLGESNRLADAREGAERQDLTFLHRATGWDARLIALAATADKLDAETRFPPGALYALFRAGLPTNKELFARVSVTAVLKALAKANDAGIVNLADRQITVARRAFANLARRTLRTARAAGTLSSVAEMLDKAGLDDTEKQSFEDLYFAHPKGGEELWQKAQEKGIPAAKIGALRLQGKLAHLTLNNAVLAESLQKEIGAPGNLADLISKDFHKAEPWKTRLHNLAGDDDQALQDLIPPAYAGETPADRLEAYAADLARKVRLSFPTQIIQRMIETDEVDFGGNVKTPVLTFLKKAEGLGFELGRVPVGAFIRDNADKLFASNTPKKAIETTTRSIKQLQRLYQITPNDEALKVAYAMSFTSASDVVAFDRDVFMERFGDKFDPKDKSASHKIAELFYRKAQQVAAVTFTFFGMAKQLDSTPNVYAISSPTKVKEEVKNELIKHYPTMESLFGSLDFCECEHCRSVLSPAAYLVDLLQFLDPDSVVWQNFLDQWKERHNGDAYDEAKYNFKKPFDALVERRPDLPHLPLTCENTHTALPYIDVVNEILEYFVANDNKLTENAVHDTGEATTPELLAEPHNIIPEAYDKLNRARYPLALPFDLWLETTRRFFEHFETPLWQVLEVLRSDDELLPPPNNAKPYYRADIFAEYLGISPAEYALFTDAAPLTKWFELYGYETEGDALEEAVDEGGQRIDLNSAKALSRRLGVSYKQLVDLMGTWFVNPKLDVLVTLRKLGGEIGDVFRYKNNEALLTKDKDALTTDEQRLVQGLIAFEERLAVITKMFTGSGFDAKEWLDTTWANGDFDNILMLADPDAGCNFDRTTLRYADTDPAKPLDFVKINLFVRLWKKLGWTIEETDRALQVFLPHDSLPLTAANLGAAFRTALIYIAHLKSLNGRVKVGKNSRLKLLTVWSNLSTTGKNPIYAQLFLTQSVLKNDPVFDDPLGNYLSKASIEKLANARDYEAIRENVQPGDALDPALIQDPAVKKLAYDEVLREQHLTFRGILLDAKKKQLTSAHPSPVFAGLLDKVQRQALDFFLIKGHLLALEAALNLTADETGRILASTGKGLDRAELSLETVSLLYRHGVFAKTLKLPVTDLIALRELSGLDPFTPLPSKPVTNIDDDHPFSQTLRFVEVAEKVKESGFKVEDLEYLLLHRFDPVGKYRPDADAPIALVKTLASEIGRIKSEQAVPEDPLAFTDEILRQKLALGLPADVAETFFAMWAGTKEYESVQAVEPDEQLEPETFAKEPTIRVSYNVGRGEQHLTVRGVLIDEKKAELKTKFPSPMVGALLDAAQTQAKMFFKQHLEESVAEKPFVGFLEADDFDPLFELSHDEKEERNRRARLANAFLPFLQQQLTRQLVAQSLATSLGSDPALTEALLTDTSLLTEPGRPGTPLLEAFSAAGERGVSVSFFDTVGNLLAPTITVASVDTARKDSTGQPIKLKPDGTKSARFAGYLEVPTTGDYRFFVISSAKGSEVELRFAHLPDPLIRGKAAGEGAETSQFTGLQRGIPNQFALDVRNLDDGDVTLSVLAEGLPRGSLGRLILYPQTAVERVARARTLLTKALQLIQGFDLSEREVRYLLTHAEDFHNLSFGKLPTQEADDPLAGATALFEQFLSLADYRRLKRELAGDTDDLIDIFENARRVHPVSADRDEAKAAVLKDIYQRFADLTRRDFATVRAAAEHLGFAAEANVVDDELRVNAIDFAQQRGIERLWEVLQVMEKVGVPLDNLAQSTRIVAGAVTSGQRFAIARDLKSTVKARYETENWQRIAQSIFDKLRQRQRDALVGYVMQNHPEGFSNVNQLFEYFLIDPGMEPVVQTSRLRLAISSVQLFVQRCLLNLEKKVHPSAIINSRHWEWMKRYRVWEANRKIWLWPENWLEPEFRDDKTHLFQELESALLQGDVSKDLVEAALFQYLKKLEELARLDIVTMYCEEKSDPRSNTLHIIGRTFNSPHKYFYRRYAYQMWTPWEPVTDIESDHVVAVMWRDRLHLFWVTFMEKAKQDPNAAEKIPEDAEVADVAKAVSTLAPPKEVEIQLNWSEYFQGQWTTREAGGFSRPIRVDVPWNFNRDEVFIYLTKELDDDGEERAVRIQLSGEQNLVTPYSDGQFLTPNKFITAFRVVSKHSSPKVVLRDPTQPSEPPYSYIGAEATRYTGSDVLEVSFRETIVDESDNAAIVHLGYGENPPTWQRIFPAAVCKPS